MFWLSGAAELKTGRVWLSVEGKSTQNRVEVEASRLSVESIAEDGFQKTDSKSIWVRFGSVAECEGEKTQRNPIRVLLMSNSGRLLPRSV